jgi:N-methylhydantoinase A/oxoprolinase/acetone carboxylase beta subunit
MEVDARYVGQYHEIIIAIPQDVGEAGLREIFEEEFLRQFGRLDHGKMVELVNVRVIGEVPVTSPPLSPSSRGPGHPSPCGTRRVFLRDGLADCPIYRRDALGPGASVTGPLIVEEMTSTTFVPPGWRLAAGPYAELLLTRET